MNKTKTESWKWLGAALLAVSCLSGKANATASLNIDVTIGGSKSVSVNTSSATVASTSTVANFGTLGPNGFVVSAGTAAVQNNSGILSEGFGLSTNPTSLDQVSGGAQTWNMVSSTAPLPGQNAFAVQAVFGSSSTIGLGCPGSGVAEWNNSVMAPPLTAVAVRYTSTVFADSSLNAGGGTSFQPDDGVQTMFANNLTLGSGNRALCYRVILPAATTITDNQIIQIIVTAM